VSQRIRTQLILAVTLISVTVFALLSYILIAAQQRSLIAQMKENSSQCIQTIKSSTRFAMMHNRREELLEIINAIGRQANVKTVRIVNKEGRVVYSPEDAETGQFVDMEAEACFGCHSEEHPQQELAEQEWSRFFTENDQRYLGIIDPIYNEPSCSEAECHAHPASQTVLGVLDLTVSIAGVHREMVTSRNKAILLTAVTIFSTGIIVLLLFHYRIGRPVGDLLSATRRVADGDLTSQIEIVRNDELGQLESSFNEMTKKLAETQNQLYQSNKMASVGRLAAGIAHEINNPLTGVLTYSSLLLSDAPDNSELKEGLEIIVRETKRSREIVKGLLDFSRQVPPHKGNADLNEIVERSLEIVDHQFKVSNIKITKGLRQNLPPIRVDAMKIGQVLLNLLVNAADAVEPGAGEIFVGTELVESSGARLVEVKVTDNGKGIPDDEQAKIFEPFYTTKESGTGLGLAVVWGIVGEHDGTISVTSKVGRGTTFSVRLPIDHPMEPAQESGQNERSS
jgi:two-component system NtrC family sensor kinase